MSSPVEQIKLRLSVVDVVSSYMKLERAGANFKARCPFHNENTPSFYVSPVRDSWHCFGCSRGGDQFQFVMDIEGVEFREALQILAARAGVELVREDPKVRGERERLFELTEAATLFYQKRLVEHRDALGYLQKRGVSSDTMKAFRLGFAPAESQGWRVIWEYLKMKGYTDDEIAKAGLIIKNTKATSAANSYYDRFRSRIMFPITDAGGRVIAFGGRIFNGKEDTAKYINSPQTVLYDKSRVLYAFDKAKMAVRNENTCILVEGYMDAIMAHQAGTANVVAVSGTALTSYQLSTLKRLADQLITSFDMDEAGQGATRRSIDLSLEMGFDVKVVTLPGKDPADAVLENPEIWREGVRNAQHVVEFFLQQGIKKYDAKTIEGKRKIAGQVLGLVAKLTHEIDKAHWVSQLAGKLGVREDVVWQDLKKIKLGPQAHAAVSQSEARRIKTRKELLRERLLGLYLWKPETFPKDFEKERFFKGTEELMKERDRLVFEAELMNIDDPAMEIEACIFELDREDIKLRLEELSEEIKEVEIQGQSEQLSNLLQEFSELSRRLAGI